MRRHCSPGVREGASLCVAYVGGICLQEWEGLTIGSLLPGMLVNVKVRNVLSDGLLVSFLTFFNGTIDCFHLTQVCPRSYSWHSLQRMHRKQLPSRHA